MEKKEPTFQLLRLDYFYGFTFYYVLVRGVIAITLGIYPYFDRGHQENNQTTAQAEERNSVHSVSLQDERIAPTSVGVITTKEKHILDMAIKLCKEGNVSPKGMGPCVERESKGMGLK